MSDANSAPAVTGPGEAKVGAGTKLKLVANSWVLAVVEAGAEAIALAEGFGLDPALFFQAIADGPLDLPYLRMKGQAMAKRATRVPRAMANQCHGRRRTASRRRRMVWARC